MSWRDFWLYSAELANEALRNNFECDELFYDTYEYYKLKMKEMEDEMYMTKTGNKMTVYRNVCFDFYDRDQVFEPTFVSCFTNKYDETYGNIKLKIIIPKGTNHLRYENVIILPSGYYKVIEKDGDNLYTLEFLRPEEIFAK